MNNPTFKEQFDKLTRAYIAGEVDPYDVCGCFVGNLLNNQGYWSLSRIYIDNDDGVLEEISTPDHSSYRDNLAKCIIKEANGFYTKDEINILEKSFVFTYQNHGGTKKNTSEDALFKAFEVTLDLLRQIHESKGEIVEDFSFVKREVII